MYVGEGHLSICGCLQIKIPIGRFEMQDDAGIGLVVHAIFDRISDNLRCNRHFFIFLFYFFAGVQPFQDAYSTKLATARMLQRHLGLRTLCGRVWGGHTGQGLMPTRDTVLYLMNFVSSALGAGL